MRPWKLLIFSWSAWAWARIASSLALLLSILPDSVPGSWAAPADWLPTAAASVSTTAKAVRRGRR